MIRYWYKWANSNSLGSFGPNFWGWRVSNRNYYRNGMSSWFKWISSEDICLKSVYKLKNVQNEHVSIMVDEVIQKLVYDHDSKMFLLVGLTEVRHVTLISILQWFAKDWRILIVLSTWKMRQSLACQFLTLFFPKFFCPEIPILMRNN